MPKPASGVSVFKFYGSLLSFPLLLAGLVLDATIQNVCPKSMGELAGYRTWAVPASAWKEQDRHKYITDFTQSIFQLNKYFVNRSNISPFIKLASIIVYWVVAGLKKDKSSFRKICLVSLVSVRRQRKRGKNWQVFPGLKVCRMRNWATLPQGQKSFIPRTRTMGSLSNYPWLLWLWGAFGVLQGPLYPPPLLSVFLYFIPYNMLLFLFSNSECWKCLIWCAL